MTVKASSVLCLVSIWAAVTTGIAFEAGAWWSVFFALLATGAVGVVLTASHTVREEADIQVTLADAQAPFDAGQHAGLT